MGWEGISPFYHTFKDFYIGVCSNREKAAHTELDLAAVTIS